MHKPEDVIAYRRRPLAGVEYLESQRDLDIRCAG